MNILGIRKEDKNKWEARVPLLPRHIDQLLDQMPVDVYVEESSIRCVPKGAYEEVGAKEVTSLNGANVVMAIKEIPEKYITENNTYIFFSHVIKGQPYNMPMLKHIMDKNATLIDYEKITNKDNRRLVFFGEHAGIAGAIDTLRGFGKRMDLKGFDNPFKDIKPAYEYETFDSATKDLHRIKDTIKTEGLDKGISPFIVTIAGYGNTSIGAQKVFKELGARFVDPYEVPVLSHMGDNKHIYVAILHKEHTVRHKGGQEFDATDYKENPHKYTSNMDSFLPYSQMFINCTYWTKKYPKLITHDMLKELDREGKLKLEIIGDITCDLKGGVEVTVKATPPDDPCYVYDFYERTMYEDYDEDGILVMAVDTLPCEMPLESSDAFGDQVMPYMKHILSCDFEKPYYDLELPEDIHKAVIVHKGKLTPDYKYLEKHIQKHA